jgi:imidazolonepropionase-like amidohydrolase
LKINILIFAFLYCYAANAISIIFIYVQSVFKNAYLNNLLKHFTQFIQMKKFIAFIVLIFFLSDFLVAQKTAIICKTLIDGTGKTIADLAIIIEGNKIVAIDKKANIPQGATIIDLGDYTLLPGMIDAHVHPDMSSDDYQVEHLRGSSASKALKGLKTVQDLLAAGWTALRVAGDADVGYADMEIRNAINKGLFVGPHIYGAAHYLSVTGGGGDINFFSYEQKIIPDGLIVDGPEEIRKAIRTEIKYGSDWIKILETGAFMTVGDNPKNVHFSPEELKAAVEEAARRDVPVMAHAHANEGIRQAVKAGVRSIEHGSFMDEESINLMIEHGTYLIPTLTIDLYFQEKISDSKALVKAIEIAKATREGVYKNLRIAIKKGVKIGVGTDYVGWPADYSAREFAELVKLGMTPMQAIQAGTKVNAELLKKENEIGTVEVGKLADIIAVKGDPLKDISELQRVKFVMIGGKVIKNEK